MFAKSIIGSARFLRMPSTSRLLYYDLGMQADDDGVVEAFSVMRTTGATEDDLRVLASKGFVRVLNEDLVTYISDWSRNNLIKKDRYHPSVYHEFLVQLNDGTQTEPDWNPDGTQMEPEVRLGKVSIGKDNISSFDFSGEKANKDKSQEKFGEETKPFKLAKWLDKRISERSPHYQRRTASQLQKWARTFDLMNRRDGIPWDDIRDVLAFSQEDPFWQTNILSADKFRKQFVQLAARMDREVERHDG